MQLYVFCFYVSVHILQQGNVILQSFKYVIRNGNDISLTNKENVGYYKNHAGNEVLISEPFVTLFYFRNIVAFICQYTSSQLHNLSNKEKVSISLQTHWLQTPSSICIYWRITSWKLNLYNLHYSTNFMFCEVQIE